MAYQGLAALLENVGSAIVYKVTDTSITQLGATIDTSASSAGITDPSGHAGGGTSCSNAWGEVWAQTAAGLHRYNPGTADDWTLVFNAPSGFGQAYPCMPHFF